VDGFDELFRREYPTVVGITRWFTRDDGRAEEVAQDAFVRLLEKWSRVRTYERPEAWVRLVAVRLALKGRRRRDRGRALEASLPLADVVDRHADTDLERAVRALPPQQRAAVVLHYFADLPVDDVAEAIGCRPATAKVHLHRARQSLAAALHDDEEVTDVRR
jgi:RNA polymerase sigma-70 factor (ECF subfamily)